LPGGKRGMQHSWGVLYFLPFPLSDLVGEVGCGALPDSETMAFPVGVQQRGLPCRPYPP